MEEGDNYEDGNQYSSFQLFLASLLFYLDSKLFNFEFLFIFRKQLGCWKQRPSQMVSKANVSPK